jgi:hypothetical protein
MKRFAALCAAGLLSLVPAIALAQHHPQGGGGHMGGGGMRPHGGGGPVGHPNGGAPYGRGGVVVRGGPPPSAYHGPAYPRGGGYNRGRVSMDGVISQIHRRYPGGRLLDAGVEDYGGREVYRVRWATGDGRRVDYIVDAQTGAIIGQED